MLVHSHPCMIWLLDIIYHYNQSSGKKFKTHAKSQKLISKGSQMHAPGTILAFFIPSGKKLLCVGFLTQGLNLHNVNIYHFYIILGELLIKPISLGWSLDFGGESPVGKTFYFGHSWNFCLYFVIFEEKILFFEIAI